jgi:hypothetical protein
MEPLLDRLKGRTGQTEEDHRPERSNLCSADARREVRDLTGGPLQNPAESVCLFFQFTVASPRA